MELNRDSLFRFTFEDAGVRGELVFLDASWRAVLERHDYPAGVREQLGQGLAAVALLSATIKFQGSMILQAQSLGPLHTLVAQATHERTLRGLARWHEPIPEGGLSEVFGEGQLVLTVDGEGSERYQGIVGLEGENLAAALEAYFAQSEQLLTRLWLVADDERAVGMMLQRMPSEELDREDWNRLTLLADTLKDEELLGLSAEQLLRRLFHEETLRLYDSEPLAFRCGCSRERIETTLRGLGRREVDSILAEKGAVEVDCDFCNKHYRFDAVDVASLFKDTVTSSAPNRTQ